MKRLIGLLVVLVMIAGIGYPVLTPAEEKKVSDPELQEKIKNLIKDLGNDEARVRERVTKELKEIGEPAVPLLKQAMESDDAEISWRARIILRAIDRKKQESNEHKDETVKPEFKIKIPHSESFVFIQEPSGKITITIKRKTTEGKEESETYTADSLEEFVRKYPEISKKYGLGKGEKDERPEITPDDLMEDFNELWQKELGRVREHMKKMEEKMKQLLEDGNPLGWELPDLIPKRQPKITPSAKQGELGMVISPVEQTLREQLKLAEDSGILVREVKKDSLAEKMGFQQYDIVLSVNDEEIENIWKFKRVMKEALQKDTVEIHIIRKGERQVLKYKKTP